MTRTNGFLATALRRMDEAARDLRGALRQARRNPGLTAAALVTLALGIGGTTAIHSVVRGVLLRPLPYPDEGRVVRLWPVAQGAGGSERSRSGWSVPDLEDWRARSSSAVALGGYTTNLGGLVVPSGSGVPEEIATAYVTSGFFEALGTLPRAGTVLPDRAERDEPRVVVLSEGFWRRRFGGDPGVVGRTLETQSGSYRIVGVMPAHFAFPSEEVELWTFLTNVPQSSVPWLERQVRVFDAVGRVAAGRPDAEEDRAAAELELEGVARALAEDLPDTNGGIRSVDLEPVRTAILGDVRTPLLLLAGSVALTLLIAGANVANLLLARGTVRGREFALRAALGAGRGRLARQVLVESLVLGFTGGAMGLVLAAWTVPLLVRGAGGLLPRSGAVALDGPVLFGALAASVGTGILVGLLPAVRVGRRGGGDLAGTARGASGGEPRTLLDGLVFTEVALAVMLLVGGGLLMRSFVTLQSVDPGFDPAGLLVADMVVGGSGVDAPEYMVFRDRLLERLEAIPGVIGASTAKEFPTRGTGEVWPWARPGDPPVLPGEERTAQALHVHRDFFEVMRIPLLAGTLPGAEADVALVINERLARAAFGSVQAAVGASLSLLGTDVPVRAVVGDVLHVDPAEPPPPMIYVDDRLNPRRVFSFVVRTVGEPLALVEPLRRAVAQESAEQPIRSIYTARNAYDEAVGQPRFFAFLMSVFAGGAAVLAAVGIHGVISYTVRRRTREIGVRVALGADRGRVRRLVVWRALRPVLGGMAVGLAGAALLSSLLGSMLFGVGTLDPLTYVGVAGLFLAVALVASWAPAREATRVDPRVALAAD